MKNSDSAAQLSAYRQTIDNLDAALVHILAERFRCTNKVGELKADQSWPATDKNREAAQHARLMGLAEGAGIDRFFVEELMRFIIGKVIQQHKKIAQEKRSE